MSAAPRRRHRQRRGRGPEENPALAQRTGRCLHRFSFEFGIRIECGVGIWPIGSLGAVGQQPERHDALDLLVALQPILDFGVAADSGEAGHVAGEQPAEPLVPIDLEGLLDGYDEMTSLAQPSHERVHLVDFEIKRFF